MAAQRVYFRRRWVDSALTERGFHAFHFILLKIIMIFFFIEDFSYLWISSMSGDNASYDLNQIKHT
jgi:hypothetical protein